MIDSISPNFEPLETAAFKNEKFNQLFAVLEDLLKRLADTDDPHIRAKRAQVRAEMIAVRKNPYTLDLDPAAEAVAAKPAPAVEPAQIEQTEADWGQQALVALAGAAMALSVFRHSS
jgi:hypothetical protein